MAEAVRTPSCQSPTAGKAPRIERDRDLDIARLLAAILILLSHASQEYWKAGGPPILDRMPWTIVGSLSLAGRVPFFLFLAGYFAARSLNKGAGSSRPYIKKRIVALLPPYLFWNMLSMIAIYIAVVGGFQMMKSDRIDGAAMFMRIVGIGLHPANASLWFIRDLLLCAFLAPLLKRLGVWILIPCVTLAIVPELPIHLVDVGCPRPSSLGYFGLGMLLVLIPRGTTARLFPRPGLGLLLCLGAGLTFLIGDFPQPALGGCSVGALGILLSARFVDQSLPAVADWMSRHANASFIVFAANSPYLAVVRQLYNKYEPAVPVWLYFGVLILLFFALCVASHTLIRRYCPKALVVITGGR